MTPPFAPDERHVIGTDEMGRDVFSLIVYGARLTIGISVVVVLFRVALSLLIGITAAFGNPLAQGSIRLSNIIFNFVPPLIICLIILKIRFFETLPKTLSFWVFVCMLTLVGWSRVAEVVQTRAEGILRQDFIRAEIAIGKSRGMIAISNVVPHLAAEMVVLAFMEIAVVLGLLMQLGAFTVFIGNLRIVENSDQGMIISKPMSFEPEWAAMMGASKTYLRTAPWLVFSPALAFFISILGFNMFGEGLRKALQAQNSKFIHRTKKYTKPIFIALSLVVAFSIFLQVSPSSTVLAMPVMLPDSESVRQGSEEMAQWLEDQLVSLGFDPVKGAYQHKYAFEPYWIADSAKVTLGKQKDKLKWNESFVVVGYGNGSYQGTLYDGTMLDVIGFEKPEMEEGQVLLLDGRYYQESMIRTYIQEVSEYNLASTFVVLLPDISVYSNLGTFNAGVPVLYVQDEDLFEAGKSVEINIECMNVTGEGINVFGLLEGNPDKVSDEAIMIGAEYNFENKEDQSSLIAALELAKSFAQQEEKLERRVLFAFWDGKHQSSGYGVHEYMKHTMYSPKDTAVYIDVSALSGKGEVVIDDSHAPHTRFYAWSLSQRAKKIGHAVGLEFISELSETRPDIYKRGPSCIQIQLRPTSDEGNDLVSIEEFTGFIVDVVLGGAY